MRGDTGTMRAPDRSAHPRTRWLIVPALAFVASAAAIRFAPDVVVRFLRGAGDNILVALAAYLVIGAVLPRLSGWKVLALTLLVTWGIQVAELFHPAWLGPFWARLRFEWSDIASSTLGGMIGFGGEIALSMFNRPPVE
jgi:hypothetical protein